MTRDAVSTTRLPLVEKLFRIAATIVSADSGRIGDAERIKGKWVLARGLKCLRLKQFPRVGGDRRNISNGERKVCFSPGEGFVTTSVYDRYHLRAGERVPGPAIVEKLDSTILIHPNYQA